MIFGRENVTLCVMIKHHDIKMLCLHYVMQNNDAGTLSLPISLNIYKFDTLL